MLQGGGQFRRDFTNCVTSPPCVSPVSFVDFKNSQHSAIFTTETVIRPGALLFCFFLFFSSQSRATGADSADTRTVSNLQRFQELVRDAVHTASVRLSLAPGTTIKATINPPDVRWFLSTSVEKALGISRAGTASADSSIVAADVALLSYGIRYKNIRHEGMFGPRLLDRETYVRVTVRFSGPVVPGGFYESEADTTALDTIDVADVERIEHPNVPATHANLPPEGFFSGWAEPVVVVASIVVAVFLLFTIRS
jgi:hypothetical protein